MPLPGPAGRPLRPQGPSRGRRTLRPPFQEGPRLARRPPDDVKLCFLPPYSPELNPDELVNADLEHSLPKQHRARDQAELAAETRRFFCRRQRQPHIVRGYFGGPHARYILDENLMSF
ncbi:transposase [Streptomyces sp. NPDC002463]|uniref:transposase n=1 Tax=Streptomyces sp. NPDC002463 TaxID=3364645 RepID=UPI00369BABFD